MKKHRKGFLLIMVLTVTLTMSVSVSTVKATPEEIEEAVNLGLAWLAASQQLDGSWPCPWGQVAATGLAVLKFENHALRQGIDPLDPSYEYFLQVRRGLDYLFSEAEIQSIPRDPPPPRGEPGEPDTDGDGIGVSIWWVLGRRTWETAIAAMAIASSTHPEMSVNVAGSDVNGWTYEEVLVDVVDWLAWAQTDPQYVNARGGWGDSGDTGNSDNWNSGYAVLGLVYAESPPPIGFGLTIPQFVKDELKRWVKFIQTKPGDPHYGPDDDGGSGYNVPGWLVNILKTGFLIQQMAFIGYEPDTPDWGWVQKAIDYIERHWNDPDWGTHYDAWRGDPPDQEACYACMVGFEAFNIDLIDLDGDHVPEHDWFNDMANALVNSQNLDGSWPKAIWADDFLATLWALLFLEKVAPPVLKYDLTVIVKDDLTGLPIPDATVIVTGPESRLGVTDANGHAEFLNLLVGDYTVTASATGYMVASATITLAADTTLEIKLTALGHATAAVVWTTDKVGTPEVVFIVGETVYVHWKANGMVNITVYFHDGTIEQQWLNLGPEGVEDFVPSKGVGYYTINCTACKEQKMIAYGTILVIPEYQLGTILSVVTCLAALAVFKSKRRIHL